MKLNQYGDVFLVQIVTPKWGPNIIASILINLDLKPFYPTMLLKCSCYFGYFTFWRLQISTHRTEFSTYIDAIDCI